MTREEIAAHNRKHMPNAVAMLDEWLPVLKERYPNLKVMHLVDNETQYEAGRAQADSIKKSDFIARRCDGTE